MELRVFAYQYADGLRITVPPHFRVALRVHHLGLRKGNGQFAPDVRAGPIDLRSVAGKDIVPIDRRAGRNRLPVCNLLGVLDDFVHVMTRRETDGFERLLE